MVKQSHQTKRRIKIVYYTVYRVYNYAHYPMYAMGLFEEWKKAISREFGKEFLTGDSL